MSVIDQIHYSMHLLQAGVEITVIALWLGHESIETTLALDYARGLSVKPALQTRSPL